MLTMPLVLEDLAPMDYRYATNTSRLAFSRAVFAADALAAGDKNLAAYHKRGVIEHAKFLEEGLTRIAKSLEG